MSDLSPTSDAPIRFLVDAMLPPALARFLTDRGYPSEHVFDACAASMADVDIWAQAARDGFVIVSKDEDFASIRLTRAEGPKVVWVRMGNTRTQALLRAFTTALPSLVAAVEGGEVLVELY